MTPSVFPVFFVIAIKICDVSASCSFLCLLFIVMFFFPAMVDASPSGTINQNALSLP